MEQQPQPQYALGPFNPEELKKFNEELQAFLDERGAHLESRAFITPNGTIDAQFRAFKKVELVPKGDGTLEVPKTEDNAENASEKTEA